jgi:magnesium chelatase family protein
MVGPARAGKTLLARATPGIQPRVKIEKALDVTRIFTVADQLAHDLPLIQTALFVPHYIHLKSNIDQGHHYCTYWCRFCNAYPGEPADIRGT